MRWVLPLLVLIGSAVVTACGGSGGSDAGQQTVGSPSQPVAVPIVTETPQPFIYSTPEPATPRAGVPTGIHSQDGTQPLPAIPDGAAVYLSLGDSINYGCCGDPALSSHPLFAQYLSQRLNRPVIWVSLAGNGTLQDFLNTGPPGGTQLDVAVKLLQSYRQEGHDVVAIALSIGGNDLLALRTEQGCTSGSPQCLTLFQKLLESYPRDMQTVYKRLNAAKDAATPILQNNLYDAQNCGRSGDDISTASLAVQIFNQRVQGATVAGGSFLMDFYMPFKGHACEYISGVDPTYAGYDAIYQVDLQTYQLLPPQYVNPWTK